MKCVELENLKNKLQELIPEREIGEKPNKEKAERIDMLLDLYLWAGDPENSIEVEEYSPLTSGE